jgi:hypothetical protein
MSETLTSAAVRGTAAATTVEMTSLPLPKQRPMKMVLTTESLAVRVMESSESILSPLLREEMQILTGTQVIFSFPLRKIEQM